MSRHAYYPPNIPDVTRSFQRPRRRRLRWLLVLLLLLGLLCDGYFLWAYHGPCPPVEIARGVVYSCQRLSSGPESGGLLHMVRADLNVPGVELFVTPQDPEAQIHQREYQLQYVSTVVQNQHLIAAVNGTLFTSDSSLIRMQGDWARSSETIVADHVPNAVDPNTYLLWWDDQMLAHLETTKPPSAAALAKAKWGIGGQQPLLVDGKYREDAGRAPDQRTMIAADPEKKLVWMAVFDRASYRFAADFMAQQGAKIGVIVDGGSSCAMVLGEQAKGVRTGTMTGNWRPVATQFGVKAPAGPG